MKNKLPAGMRCEMARLQCKASDLGPGSMVDVRRINRAIASAVRAERARCVAVVEACQRETVSQIPFVVCDDIIERMKGGG